MSTIEEFIAQNRTAIDQVDLPTAHRERMQARLAKVAVKRHRQRIALWIGSISSAAAAVIALALFLLPPTPSTPHYEPLTAEQLEAIEVEQYYRAQRDRAINEVCAILKNNNSAAVAQISYDLAELKINFEADPLPQTLFENDTERYIALTIARLTAQKEVVDQMKHLIINI